MSQDGITRTQQAVQPRAIPSVGLATTSSADSSSYTAVLQSISEADSASATDSFHPVFSIVTTDYDFGSDPCTAALPAGGILQINDTFTLYLEDPLQYIAQCANHSIFGNNCTGNSTVLSFGDPFYASVSPQVYVLAAATVISYLLVIIIFITPRTFYVGGPASGTGASGPASGLRTLIPGTGGRHSSVIGIGRRPLLQKIAALMVAISLTIATTDTFRVAEHQYVSGFEDAGELAQEVVNSLEIRITRVISDTFLWLAQVQTLIRLFPRHKEKVTIKWLGFGLVLCDTVFSILENFVSGTSRYLPGKISDAIPALSYLFELAIGLIYASCVLYYALSKRRFAFWHSKMRNVCLVALLSVIAVLIPVVFFITDLAQPDISVWGEYIRWVGAAAASVVVWEWVERIEALERDEKKDGILGREVFDGDEMLDMTPDEGDYNRDRRHPPSETNVNKNSQFWKNVRELRLDMQPNFPLRRRRKAKAQGNEENPSTIINGESGKSESNQVKRPPQAITPISRSDTNSAASTVYAVRYHDTFSPSPAIPEDRAVDERQDSAPLNTLPAISDESTLTNSTATSMDQQKPLEDEPAATLSVGKQIWQGVANPFKRKRTEPPAEVAAQIAESNLRRSPFDGPFHLKQRMKAFSLTQRGQAGGRSSRNRTPVAVTFIPARPRDSREHTGTTDETEAIVAPPRQTTGRSESPNSITGSPNLASLPVTIIPAPKRGERTWSPDDMAQDEPDTPPIEENGPPAFRFGQHGAESHAGLHEDSSPTALVHSRRGTLVISESPGRLREGHANRNGTPSSVRSRNNRSTTIASINNRLGNASPARMSNSSGPRPATTESAGPSVSSIVDDSGRRGSG